MNCAAQRSAAQRSAAQRSAAQRSAAQRSAAQRSAAQRSAAQRSCNDGTSLYFSVPLSFSVNNHDHDVTRCAATHRDKPRHDALRRVAMQPVAMHRFVTKQDTVA